MFSSRKLCSVVSFMLLVGAIGLAPGAAHARKGDCAQPFSDSATGPVATDCLFLLRAATGSETCDTPCICDADSSGATVATDALLCLIESVGTAPLNCTCPALKSATYTFNPALAADSCPFAAQRAAMVSTDYLGAFDPALAPAVGNWTLGWTIEHNAPATPGAQPNRTVWQTATGGTLGGAAPTANGACPAGTTDIGDTTLPAAAGPGTMDICELAAAYTVDGTVINLTNDNVYRTNSGGSQGTKLGDGDAEFSTPGSVANVTMNVEPGTLILGGATEALAVTRGSQLNLLGTAVDPIVLTSVDQFEAWRDGGNGDGARQEWGGLVLTGFGDANQCNNPGTCDFLLEGFLTPFYSGGTDDTDNSGTIQYTVIRQAGFDIDGNGNELNCLTMFQVGSGTTINHVQCHDNVDDGFEFFGGAVNIDHVLTTGIGDDNIDTDLGWRGSVQFAVTNQSAEPDDGDRAFEMDSHPNPGIDARVSTPCLVNITSLGESDVSTEGANIGSGTNAYFWNGIIKGATERAIAFENGTLSLRDGCPAPDQAEDLRIENYYIDTPNASAGEITAAAPDTVPCADAWYNLAGKNNRRQSVDGGVGINSVGYPSQETF